MSELTTSVVVVTSFPAIRAGIAYFPSDFCAPMHVTSVESFPLFEGYVNMNVQQFKSNKKI